MEDILFWIFEKLFVFIILPIFILFILFIPFGIYSSLKTESNCINKEKQLVHHPAWVQYIYSGKVMFPIYHSAYDSMDWVCTEYKELSVKPAL